MNFKNKYPSLIVAVLVLLISACTKEYATISEEDEQNIQAYISKNNLSVTKFDTTGAYYSIVQEGSGPALDYTKQIPLIYTVKSLDGSYSLQDTFINHYAGLFGYYTPALLRQAVMENLKNEGGTIRVIIPSRKAYGRNGNGTIPGNASLDYTVKVVERAKLPQYEDVVIQKYLSSNSLTGFSKSPEGIYYKIGEAGTGTGLIQLDSTIAVDYTGRLLNGTVFETNDSVSVVLSSFIPSWQKIVPMLKKGGSVRFVAPSSFSYGLAGNPASSVGQISIPSFAPLDFEVKVRK